jgi:CheY-like chemotaxis protein
MRRRPNILLVEDNSSIRLLIERMLENCDVHLIAAEDGFQAIEACRKEKMDLILMDIVMPKMSGYETAAAIRKDLSTNCGVPIFAITASICDVEFHAYGMDECIEKPFDVPDLYEKLNAHLGAVCRI